MKATSFLLYPFHPRNRTYRIDRDTGPDFTIEYSEGSVVSNCFIVALCNWINNIVHGRKCKIQFFYSRNKGEIVPHIHFATVNSDGFYEDFTFLEGKKPKCTFLFRGRHRRIKLMEGDPILL